LNSLYRIEQVITSDYRMIKGLGLKPDDDI